MIVDTSAILAIGLGEPEQKKFLNLIQDSEENYISAVSYLELSMVALKRGDVLSERRMEQLLEKLNIVIAPISVVQAKIAKDAFRDFGKGRHKAGLNLGDCFSYALARERKEPLLFKGNYFSKTDITSALA